jgi:AcrR family transcriptional regulator
MKKASVRQFAFQDQPLAERIRQRKQPLQDRAKVTSEALLEATLQVLVREGYGRLTTTRVAERAGVSVGTLYQYFPDKRSLVMALKQRYFDLMLGAMAKVMRDQAGANPEAIIRASLAALIAVKRENVALSLALREPLAEPEAGGIMVELMGRFVDLLAGLLGSAFPRRKDIGERAALLVAVIEGALGHAVAAAPHWLEEQWFLDDLTQVAVNYLRSLEEKN